MKKIVLLKAWLIIASLMGSNVVAESSSCDPCVSSCDPCVSSCDPCNDCGSTSCFGSCSSSCHSNTFFRPRPLSQNSVLELALHNYDFYHKGFLGNESCYPWLSVDASVFYYTSTNKDKLAEFFLPCNRECAEVVEQGAGSLNSLWFGIIAPPYGDGVDTDQYNYFKSTFSIKPRRKTVGVTFGGRVDFGGFCDTPCMSKMWASIFVPVIHVKNKLDICEVVENNEVGDIAGHKTLTESLSNSERMFQRFYCDSKSTTGVDDINVKLGWDFLKCEDYYHLGLYGLAYIPTGRRSKADFAFEPTFGSGKHTGIGGGLNADYVFSDDCNRIWTWMTDLRYAYFVKGDERRTFDLCKNGDWSRNLLVVKEEATTNVMPGVNFFTKCVPVTPGSEFELWTAVHYERCDWNFEFGYDFWWRQSEEICLNKCAQPLVGIYDITGVCKQPSTSASDACISTVNFASNPRVPVGDDTFTAVTNDDFLVSSAEHPQAMSSQIYGSLSYDRYWCNRPVMMGFGVSYEFAHQRNALSQVGVWFTTGMSF